MNWQRSRHLLNILMVLGSQMLLPLAAQAQTRQFQNTATAVYTNTTSGAVININTNPLSTSVSNLLIDPGGRITGCGGEILSNYSGFSVGLYNPLPGDPTGSEIGSVLSLTATAIPATGKTPLGVAPNSQNSNPFFLTNTDQGRYNFLLDSARGQLDEGKTYLLVVNPPSNSLYSQRRVRLSLGTRNGNQLSYTATSVDGKPIASDSDATSVSGTVTINNAEQIGLVLTILSLNLGVCQAQDIQVIKTGDRASAEPGDFVIYRVAVRNLSTSNINDLTLTDTLPLGIQYVAGSIRAELNGSRVPITATQNNRNLTLTLGVPLPAAQSITSTPTVNIAYAAVVTPDALRGSGQNSVSATGRRADNRRTVRDGPVSHRLLIQPGIVSDCGTLIGRVFVDRNQDGEQQPDEPGIPNAVILTDDGNRIVTDANGLFSMANVLAGSRTAVLDLSSIPGYTLAPNQKFIERNSQSRVVRLAPGSLARVNFGVLPISASNPAPAAGGGL